MKKPVYNGIRFDSKLEMDIYKVVEKDPNWTYHGIKLNYRITYDMPNGAKFTTTHTYSPDFTELKGKSTVYWEAKGRFYTQENIKSILRLSKLISGGSQRYGIILQNPDVKVLGRKNLTMAEWCDKHEIMYINFSQLKKRYEL